MSNSDLTSIDTGKQQTVLVIRNGEEKVPDLVECFAGKAVIKTVDAIDEAVQIIRKQRVDLIVADPACLPSAEQLFTSQSAELILEHASQGVCIVEQNGEIAWANPKMLDFPDELRRKVSELCVEAFGWATGGDAKRASLRRGRRLSFEINKHIYDVNVTPVIDLNNEVTQVAAVVLDASRLRTLQGKIDAIDKAAEELVSLDAEHINSLDTQARLDLLEQKVIRYTRELMHFDNFSVHILDEKTNRLELVLSAGMPDQVQEIPIYASLQGNGITGYVAAQGRSYICPDVRQDDRYIAGIDNARSSLTVPLRLHDKVIGVFNVESNELAAFNEDDRQFAGIFARHIAMALHILNLLVTERHKTTGQLSSDLASEITAPLNDILTDVGSLIEDYLGHDELRRRFNQISDNAVRIRDAIRQVTTPDRGLVDRKRVCSSTAVRHDPVLKGRKILVVDDEEVIRETVCDVLRSYGCDIESAGDGDVGIELIEKNDFDLVLSDIRMPTKTGYEVFSAAKDRNKDCPVILMTGFGYDPNHSIVRARREGLAAVLFKPFKVEQLLGEIRTAIRSASGS